MAEKFGEGEANAGRGGQHCSVLLTSLPPEWFRLEDSNKRDALGPTMNVLKVSCSDESKRTAIVRVSKLPGAKPVLKYPRTSVAPIIINEKTSISFTLTGSREFNLLEALAKSLNMEMRKQGTATYTVTGNLDMIIDFRQELEERIMKAHANSPDNPNPKLSAESVVPAASAVTVDTPPEYEEVHDPLNTDVLVMMNSMNITPGVQYNLNVGVVSFDQRVENCKETFYNQYNQMCRSKFKSETIQVPNHISVSLLKSELKSLKEKHDQCHFAIMEESLELRLVSTSSRQLDSLLAYLKDFLLCSNNLSHDMAGGRVLKLLRRDIVKEQVDIIVNAANGRLSHAGGLAAAINVASQGEVQQLSNKYMRARFLKSIPVGEVAVTSAGKHLHCKNIIHAVGPESTHHNCRGIMNKLVHTILNEGEKCGAQSIALPAISTGIFGVSKDLVAQCFFKSITNHRFSKLPPVLEDIRIVIIDQPTFDCFHQHFKSILLNDGSAVTLKRSSSLPSDHAHVVSSPNLTYARAASEYLGDGKAERTSSRPSDNSRPKNDGNLNKSHRDRKSTSPNGSDEISKRNDRHDHKLNSENEEDLDTAVDSTKKGYRYDQNDPKNEFSVSKNGFNGATGDGTPEEKLEVEKLEGAGRDETEHENTSNPPPEGKKIPKPSEGSDNSNGGKETFFDATNKERDETITKKEGEGVITSEASEDNNDPTLIDVNPEESPEEKAIEYPKMDSHSHTDEFIGSQNSPKAEITPVATFGTSLSQHVLSVSTVVASSISMPQHMLPTYSAPNVPLVSHNHPSGLNPNASVYSSPNLGKCVTCNGSTVSAKSCGHHKCADCDAVQYPLCPVCFPWLRDVPYCETIPATSMTVQLSEMSVSGYSPHDTIVIQFKSPAYVYKDESWYGDATLSIMLPNTNEGREVSQLFQRNFNDKHIFTLWEIQQGIYKVILTHSLIKIKADGGGQWGYPDPGYLEKVKQVLKKLSSNFYSVTV